MKLNSSTPEADDEESGDTAVRKRDWLKSVQLWTPHPSEEDNVRMPHFHLRQFLFPSKGISKLMDPSSLLIDLFREALGYQFLRRRASPPPHYSLSSRRSGPYKSRQCSRWRRSGFQMPLRRRRRQVPLLRPEEQEGAAPAEEMRSAHRLTARPGGAGPRSSTAASWTPLTSSAAPRVTLSLSLSYFCTVIYE